MTAYSRDEALAFIDAMRLTLEGRVGFKWLVAKLSDLSAYIESIAAENEQLNAYIDSVEARSGFDAYRAARTSEAADDEPTRSS